MGGSSGMSGLFDDDDHGGSSFSFSGMPGGMPGSMNRPKGSRQQSSPRRGSLSDFFANGGPPPRQTPFESPSEISRPLKVSLEDLYAGSTKHLKVGRKLLSGGTEEKVLEIQIHPGWKSGTKVRFPKAGNEQPPHGEAQDLVFVVEEKPHERFTREGNDLVTQEKISLVDALTNAGGSRTIQALDGKRVTVALPSGVVKSGSQSRVSGQGMPVRKDGQVKSKGDLIVRWDVTFPERLTSAQKEGIKKVLA